MADTPRTTPAYSLKPGWLADDLKLAAERVASGFATPRELRLAAALEPLARNADFYKPEVLDAEFVKIPLQLLRDARAALQQS